MEKEKVGGGEGNRFGGETFCGAPCPDAPRLAGPTSVCGDGEEPPQSPTQIASGFNVENGILERLSLGVMPQRLRGSPGDDKRLGVKFGGLCFISGIVLAEVSKAKSEPRGLQGSSESQAFRAQAKGLRSHFWAGQTSPRQRRETGIGVVGRCSEEGRAVL